MTAAEGNLLLEAQDVSYRYPDGSAGLDGCTLAIAPGTRNALLGANGAGKTTLLQHCNGLLRPASGAALSITNRASTTRNAGSPRALARSAASTRVVQFMRSAPVVPAG